MVDTRNSKGGGRLGVARKHNKGTQTEPPLPPPAAVVVVEYTNTSSTSTSTGTTGTTGTTSSSSEATADSTPRDDSCVEAGSGKKNTDPDKRKRKGAPPDDNPALASYDLEHARYYYDLSSDKRARIAEEEHVLARADGRGGKVPARFRLLQSMVPPHIKSNVLSKVDGLLRPDCHPGERAKLSKWLESFLKLPHGVRTPLPVSHNSPKQDISDFVAKTKAKLDSNIPSRLGLELDTAQWANLVVISHL